MSRLELAAFIAAEFRRRKINIVLSGGSCVSIYSAEKYVSMDLDFVNAGFAKRAAIRETMEFLGLSEKNRYFRHPDTELLVEFPPGPLAVGEEPVKQIDEITTETGVLRIYSKPPADPDPDFVVLKCPKHKEHVFTFQQIGEAIREIQEGE